MVEWPEMSKIIAGWALQQRRGCAGAWALWSAVAAGERRQAAGTQMWCATPPAATAGPTDIR